LSVYERLLRSRLLLNRALRLSNGPTSSSLLGVALEALLSQCAEVRIVQVGANDGVHNDSLYELARDYADRTHLLLIEPQTALIPLLSNNYSWHRDVTICEAAVGAPGQFDLFGIAPEHWFSCQPRYAADWPTYRAPTGVASQSKEHVVNWARKYYKGDHDVTDLVVAQRVRSMPLPNILTEVRWPRDFDILQIDAEGFDDRVLYHCGLGTSAPSLINFEVCHLGNPRAYALSSYLRSLGYSLHTHGDDVLAIKSQKARDMAQG
jgi:FkbM family methyltransferase